MSGYTLGIDLGTSSSKGVVAALDGTIVARASSPHDVSYPRPGFAEVDADAVWWGDLVRLCRELVPQVPDGSLAAVGLSGVGPCLLLTDDALRPTGPAILYGIDMRAVDEINELTERYGADRILARGGSALSSQAVGPKMLWQRRHRPEAWARSTKWFNSNSYLAAKLTGCYAIDHHTASQCDPLYDIAERRWIDEWCADVAPGMAMPDLLEPAAVVGTVTAEASEATGLPAGTPVSIGTVDAWAEGFSAGVRRPGDLLLMYGSTMFFVQYVDRPVSHPLLWTTAGVTAGSYSIAAGMSTSGTLTQWVRSLVGDPPFEDLVTEASAVPAGSNGLVMLPYFAGERTPVFDPDARGVIAGLGLQHGRGHLFRAAYEGVACGIRQIIELLDATGGPAHRTMAVGGGTQGGLWTQIVSDVTGRSQLVPRETIGACYGDALLAAIGTGLVPPDTDWARLDTIVEPNPDNAEIYASLYDTYGQVYPATRDLVHRLVRPVPRGA